MEGVHRGGARCLTKRALFIGFLRLEGFRERALAAVLRRGSGILYVLRKGEDSLPLAALIPKFAFGVLEKWLVEDSKSLVYQKTQDNAAPCMKLG